MTGMPAAGRPPSNSEFWDIKKFIDKAAKVTGSNDKVAIRSSIPDATKEATEKALAASKSAEQSRSDVGVAKEQAVKANSLADSAKLAAEKAKDFSLYAAVGVVLAVLALWVTFYIEMHSQHKQMRPKIEAIQTENTKLKERVVVLEDYISKSSLPELQESAPVKPE